MLISATYASRIYTIMGGNITITNMGRARIQKYEDHMLLIKEHQQPGKMSASSNILVL